MTLIKVAGEIANEEISFPASSVVVVRSKNGGNVVMVRLAGGGEERFTGERAASFLAQWDAANARPSNKPGRPARLREGG